MPDKLPQSTRYAIYLRKSRADMDAEARGEGETLSRHRRALMELAQRRGLNVVRIYEEIVTGDTIAARPQMQALLSAIGNGEYTGVIVNDIDRLGRGDSIDQGIIKQAFYSTNTLIVTPAKIYDPKSEADDDSFEFSLFFSRYEYRKITRRMQTGRVRSAEEGNYISPFAPYGYQKVRHPVTGGITLVPVPGEDEVVKMIFDWYIEGGIGCGGIAEKLNNLGEHTRNGQDFSANAIAKILKNETYTGTFTWGKTRKKKQIIDGQRVEKRELNATPATVKEACPAIIDPSTFAKAQAMFSSRAKPANHTAAKLVNPTSGLLRCAVCGRMMRTKMSRPRYYAVRCVTRGCPTSSIELKMVEESILHALQEWVCKYSASDKQSPNNTKEAEIKLLRKQIDALNKQRDRLYDLLEQGVYSPQDFLRRRETADERLSALQGQLVEVENTIPQDEIVIEQLPQIRKVLDAYPLTKDAELKNKLLKSILVRIDYDKTHICSQNENPAEYLHLTLYPARKNDYK